jgi:hypothetical protein
MALADEIRDYIARFGTSKTEITEKHSIAIAARRISRSSTMQPKSGRRPQFGFSSNCCAIPATAISGTSRFSMRAQ